MPLVGAECHVDVAAEPCLGAGPGVGASAIKTIAWDVKRACPLLARFIHDQHGMVDLFTERRLPWRIPRSHVTHRKWPAAGALSRVGA